MSVIETGLAFLVFLAPLLFLGLLTTAVGGITGLGTRRWHHPLRVGHSGTSGDDGKARPVLASDVERDGALRTISHAVGEGRLTLDEAERRIEGVLHSRHRHELVELVGDLPPHARWKPGDGRGSSTQPLRLLALAAVTTLAAVVVQAVAGLWELWPVAVAGCGLWAARPRR